MVNFKKHGQESASFGQWLTGSLRENPKYQDYAVYYDHGDSVAQPNMVAIKGIYGEKVTSSTQLTQVDVMVAKPNREIVALVEIEESQCSPKNIIGDVFANLMCSQYSILENGKHQYFSITPQTILIIAGIINLKGSKFAQLESIIKPRMCDFSAPDDAVRLDKVEFIFEDRIEAVIEELKIYFENLLNN